jgi:hypothetical protein
MSGHGLNLPFEADPGEPFSLDLADADLSGGVVVMAAAAPTEDGRTVPLIVFRFAKPDGSGFYRPIVLGPDDVGDLRSLVPLVTSAVEAAIKAAGR